MQEYREKKMDKKKAKKPTDQNSFHGTNKYTNGSYGYISVFDVLFYFLLQNQYSPEITNNNSRICKVPTKHMRVQKAENWPEGVLYYLNLQPNWYSNGQAPWISK